MISQRDAWIDNFAEWVPLAQASKIMGVTQSSILRNGYAGRYPFRWKYGHAFYYRSSLVRGEMGCPKVIVKAKQTLNREGQKLVMNYRDYLAQEFDDFVMEVRQEEDGTFNACVIVCLNGKYHELPPKFLLKQKYQKKSA
ncbi:hypothetical protein SH501x_000796 [Pirellulaceae bacterium SH501]|jgi:hypothetical protein